MSFHFNVDILSDKMGQLKITGYQFRSNEYRKGPIEFMLGMCSGLSVDQFDIPNLLKQSNLRCPFIKEKNYYAYNMAPNATNMPPLLPSGRWMMEFKYLYMNQYEIFIIEWYTGIEYDAGFRY
ncbi:hypothetical protein ILUMI_01715 [Ignelater luminosus]|uniref:Uncharacterized protein n=1 Tax=Ignelater luminosus TaxID=2038154 RepID=A0A8K0DDW3_IGNLU|nr:hypothetical protein ILUMI_01715 [Ignelater luminosus]